MIQYRTSVADQTSAIRHPICARCGVICPAGGIAIYVPHPSGALDAFFYHDGCYPVEEPPQGGDTP